MGFFRFAKRMLHVFLYEIHNIRDSRTKIFILVVYCGDVLNVFDDDGKYNFIYK